jgi:LuxR family maltose regulon positive regulatory protein
VASLSESVAAGRIRLLLAQGTAPSRASAYEEQVQAVLKEAQAPSQAFHETREIRRGLAVRVLIAQQRMPEALSILARMESEARSISRTAVLIEGLGLKALASPSRHQAMEALTEALDLAQPEGFYRSLLDLNPLRPDILPELLEALAGHPFASTLLAALPSSSPAALPSQPPAVYASKSGHKTLVEPLTGRELEILALLAAGLTNVQISERLFITAGTVKAHTSNIYRKLDAANRTQAVALAREYGLIDQK